VISVVIAAISRLAAEPADANPFPQRKSKKGLREGRLAELKRELAAPNLANAEKAKLVKDQSSYEKLVASLREPRRPRS
jgi:hypothetical protein